MCPLLYSPVLGSPACMMGFTFCGSFSAAKILLLVAALTSEVPVMMAQTMGLQIPTKDGIISILGALGIQ